MNSTLNSIRPPTTPSPFDLQCNEEYQRWRDAKLRCYPHNLADTLVEIKDPSKLSNAERDALLLQCRQTNMVIYSCTKADFDKQDLKQLCAQLGMRQLDNNLCADEDGVSSIQVEPKGTKQEYIPYSDHAISWHTDGYYNTEAHRIRGMVLHCVCPAAQGGVNALIDHERIYIELRESDPDLVKALMQPDAMTIPANIQSGVEIRPAQTGPVFSLHPQSGALHMRYTARTRSIEWRADAVTQRAVQALSDLLSASADYIYEHRLEAGQGIISNNVLHSRTRIVDSGPHKRLLYRARYYDRVSQAAELAGDEVGQDCN